MEKYKTNVIILGRIGRTQCQRETDEATEPALARRTRVAASLACSAL